jgi:hypothetical protein
MIIPLSLYWGLSYLARLGAVKRVLSCMARMSRELLETT